MRRFGALIEALVCGSKSGVCSHRIAPGVLSALICEIDGLGGSDGHIF